MGDGSTGLPSVPGIRPDTGARPASGARPGGGRSKYALSNWRVRWRVVAMVAVPSVTAAFLGGFSIYGNASGWLADGRVQNLAHVNVSVVRLAQALEDERDLSAGYAANPLATGDLAVRLRSAQVASAQAARTVRAQAAGIGPGAGYQTAVVEDLGALLDNVTQLQRVRPAVFTSPASAARTVQTVADQAIQAADTFSVSVGNGTSDADLNGNVTALGALLRAENQMSLQRALLFVALSTSPPTLTPAQLTSLLQAQQQQAADQAGFTTAASPAELQSFSSTVSGSQVALARTQEALALTNAFSDQPLDALNSVSSTKLTAEGWNGAMTATITDTRQVAGQLVAAIADRASALRSQATTGLLLASALTLALLGLVVLVSTLVARSLIRPLRKLRSDALEVADRKLPEVVTRLSQSEGTDYSVDIEPIGITSTEEIGEVARAFDQVHREAVRLAADEAMLRGNLNAMFINLSRRSQSLIERQLSLIDSLEQSEQDPGRLSSLFRLDHLATRMRRNSENLLVLAGHEVARRWSQPVALVDVLRAAISEIEQYERVVLNVQPGIVVVGQAVNDVVHLVAEIVENATTFSPEDTQVYVSGQPLSSGGVLLDITDNGVGISDQEMAHANWRLDNPPVVDVAVSRRMGLFVVGRLAARHGVRVRLRHAQAGGLTALIWLPETVAAPEVAAPLGRLRKFEADDFGPTPSLSAPPASSATSASAQASAAARIPRFSSPGPSSPSFTPGTDPLGTGPLGDGPRHGDPLGPVSSPQLPTVGPGAGAGVPPLPVRGAAQADAAPPSGLSPDGPGGPVRLPSFGGGQPPAAREAVRDDGAGADSQVNDPFEAILRDRAARQASTREGRARDDGPADWASSPGSGSSDVGRDWGSDRDWASSGGEDTRSWASGPGDSSDWDTPDSDYGPADMPLGEAELPASPSLSGLGFSNGNGHGNGARPGEVTIPPASVQDQRLPIFDSLESDWFRRSGKSLTAKVPQPGTGPQPVSAGTGPQPVMPAGQQAATWTSPADEGWRKAQIVAAPAAGETTTAGLPKRVPRANLVPGSVGESERDGAAAATLPARSADDIRSRMSSFQRGVREGRAAAPQIEEQ